MNFYIGVIKSVKDNYEIEWRIPEVVDNLGEGNYMTAIPINKNTQQVRVGDRVIIQQLDDDVQEYFYWTVNEKTFTGIKFGNVVMNITDSSGKKDPKQDDDMDLSFDITALSSPWYKEGGTPVAEVYGNANKGVFITYSKTKSQIKMDNTGIDIQSTAGMISIGAAGKTIMAPIMSGANAGNPIFAGPPACPITGVPLAMSIGTLTGPIKIM